MVVLFSLKAQAVGFAIKIKMVHFLITYINTFGIALNEKGPEIPGPLII